MKSDYNDWFEQTYPQLSNYGLWLRGEELNSCRAEDFSASEFKVLISRLSTSRDTTDSITHKILFQIATAIPGSFVDLAYLPPPRDSELFDRDQIPWILGTTTKRDATQFNLIAFSNSIIQELVNIGTMLKKSNIPLSKKERLDRTDIPLIILGGANALNTSLLLGDDPVVDGIFAGEDPKLIEQIFTIAREVVSNKSKAEVLEKLNSIPGFFQPDQKRKTTKHISSRLSTEGLLYKAPVFYEEEQPSRAKLQISEGCPCFCSFCLESWARKPYRELSHGDLLDHASKMKASMGLDSVELYSFNFNMHGEFYPLLWDLHSIFSSVSMKSQRFDLIAENYELPRILHAAAKSSFTCGLEGISFRLRSYLHKSLTEKNLHSALNQLLRTPLRELKIFLIATGLENEQDFEDFKSLLSRISEIMVSAGRKPRIIFSLTPLVRFPFTPLEFEAAPDFSTYKKIINQIGRLVRCRGFEFRVSCDLQEYILSQILSRATAPAVCEAVLQACTQTGFVYYQEVSDEFLECLKGRLIDKGVCFDDLLRGVNWTEKSRVPVELPLDCGFLSVIKNECLESVDHGYCMGNYEKDGECRGCGACSDDLTRSKITSSRSRSFYTPEKLRERVLTSAHDTVTFNFEVEIPSNRRGIPRKIIAMALAKSLMNYDRRLVEGYRGFGGSTVQNRWGWSWICGFDCLSLNWNSSGISVIEEAFKNPQFLEIINRQLDQWCILKGRGVVESNTILKLSLRSPYYFDSSNYFRAHALKSTVIKSSSGSYCHKFSSQSIKKKVIEHMETFRQGDMHGVLISPSEKFELYQFLKSCFKCPTDKELVRIDICCLT